MSVMPTAQLPCASHTHTHLCALACSPWCEQMTTKTTWRFWCTPWNERENKSNVLSNFKDNLDKKKNSDMYVSELLDDFQRWQNCMLYCLYMWEFYLHSSCPSIVEHIYRKSSNHYFTAHFCGEFWPGWSVCHPVEMKMDYSLQAWLIRRHVAQIKCLWAVWPQRAAIFHWN